MSADEKAFDSKPDQKAKKHRSPAFPFIAIGDAINRLQVIFRHDKRAWTTAEAILSHLGFKGSARSGTAGRVIAALKQYGLLDENAGQYRVSDAGFRILHLPDDSDERATLIRQAALTPQIFQRLLAHYQGELPSDAALRSHLILHEKFNPDSVNHFIRVFRQTVDIANPSPEDYTAGEESEEVGQQPLTVGRPAMQQPSHTLPTHKGQGTPPFQQSEQKSLFQYNVPLSIQRDVNAHLVITGTSLKKRDLDVLARKVKDLLDAFEEEEEAEPTMTNIEEPKTAVRRAVPLPAKTIPELFKDDLDDAFGGDE